jgi:hypothetical protein
MERVRGRWLPLYQPTPPKHIAEVLSHLFALSREIETDRAYRLSQKEAALSPNILMNVRQSGSVPSPRQLQALKIRLSMTIGGVFKLFGFSLDRMRAVESLLNGARTRFVESYPFYRDRPIDLPSKLGDQASFQRTSFLSEFVREWQRGIPIRALHGPQWQNNEILYGQLGSGDTLAMPKIPPGSFVAIRPISEQERQSPEPRRYYFLQHGAGYMCCGCAVRQGRLTIMTQDHNYLGHYEFQYPGEIRIVGRVLSFGVHLPLIQPTPESPRRGHKAAPLILPWEHKSLVQAISAERLRFGITEGELESLSEILEKHLGVGISARTLRRYEHNGERVPHTAVLLGMALVHSLRMTDVFKALELWTDEARDYSLTTLMKANSRADLPAAFQSAEAPEPLSLWQPFVQEWGEWPTLLSLAIPDLARWGRRIFRVDQSAWFKGLDPFIAPHSVLVLDEQDVSPPTHIEKHKENWARPFYAFRHEERTYCGYVEVDGQHLVLIPHPLAATVPRIVFRRTQAQIFGRVIAVTSPL